MNIQIQTEAQKIDFNKLRKVRGYRKRMNYYDLIRCSLMEFLDYVLDNWDCRIKFRPLGLTSKVLKEIAKEIKKSDAYLKIEFNK